MAQSWRQLLDAGVQAGELTRAQAQRIVRQLVKEGQLAEERARSAVDELVARSRKRTDELRKLVRKEIQTQLSALGLATKQDIARLERKIAKASPAPAKRPRAKTASSGSK